MERFPIEKNRYLQSVGKLLPHRVGQILNEIGYTTKNNYNVWINPDQSNGVDLFVWLNNEPVVVAEVLNWSIGSKLSEKRMNEIIENLTSYRCKKILIYTVLNINDHKEIDFCEFTRNEIFLLKIGYQVLPKFFFNFFVKKRQVESRRIDTKEAKEDIKTKIQNSL